MWPDPNHPRVSPSPAQTRNAGRRRVSGVAPLVLSAEPSMEEPERLVGRVKALGMAPKDAELLEAVVASYGLVGGRLSPRDSGCPGVGVSGSPPGRKPWVWFPLELRRSS